MFYLAVRQLSARKIQTTLILLGVMLGTTIYVLIAGIQLGLRDYISAQLLNNTAHIRIKGSENLIDAEDLTPRFFGDHLVRWFVPPAGKRDESKLENYQVWADRLGRDPEVLSFAPRLAVDGIASSGAIRRPIAINGIDPQRQTKVTSIEEYMSVGSMMDLSGGGNKIVLGSGVMEKLGAQVLDTVKITVGTGEERPFKIVGILDFGNNQIDDVAAYANLRDVQQLNHTPGRVSEISVALVDIDRSRKVAQEWDRMSREKVQNWEEVNVHFMQMIRIQDIVRLIITFAILIVAAFGIYNVLSIMISQKRREIAILRAIGYAPKKILELFFMQGLLLGVSGAILGIILGLALNLYIGSIDLGFRIGKGTHLLISYEPSIYITAFFAALAAAALASFIPAMAASRLSPMQIIRSE